MSAGVSFLPASGKDLDGLIEVAAGSLASARWRGDATYSAMTDALRDDDAPTQDAPTQDLPMHELPTQDLPAPGVLTKSLGSGPGPTQ